MEDTVRLKAINDIANIGYMNDQPDSAFYCAQLQYDLAASADNKRWMIKSLQLKGQSLWRRGDMHSAIDCFSKELGLAEDINYKRGVSASYNSLANVYFELGELVVAIDYYSKSLSFS